MAKLTRDQFIKKFEVMGFDKQYAAKAVDGAFHHLINREEDEINEQAPAIIDEIIKTKQIADAKGHDKAPVAARAPERSLAERERDLERRMRELELRESDVGLREREAQLRVREQQRGGFFGAAPTAPDTNRESGDQNQGGF